jgi:Spy/CpxP family protein refolding chaperone
MKMTRIALVAASLTVCSFAVLAANVEAAPSPSQESLVQHLKLSNDLVKKIEDLHKTLEQNLSQIPMTGVKDGALIEIFQAGKWNESVVKSQFAACSKMEQQERYYRVNYSFDISKVLTLEQCKQGKTDIANALATSNDTRACRGFFIS